jgi:hypothetical protein
MADPVNSVPPPSAGPPAGDDAAAAPAPVAPEATFALESSRGRRKPRVSEFDRLTLTSRGVTLEHGSVLRAPLEVPLALVKVAALDPGPAKVSGQVGRFPVLRRLGPTTVIPRTEGIEGWLWTSSGGTALTNLGDDDAAPNAALVFGKPLDEGLVRVAFDPDFLTEVAARSPLGVPAVVGLLFRIADTLAAGNGFRRWGFQDLITDREIPPVQRRHLPTDRPADPKVGAHGGADPRAATSVAPPGFS